MERYFAIIATFVLLSATLTFADDASTGKAKDWPYGPYDKLHRARKVVEQTQPLIIIRSSTNLITKIVILHGTQEEIVDLTKTNILFSPDLKWRPWRPE
jgi:hypothetical protein